jgi:hypothetical protein
VKKKLELSKLSAGNLEDLKEFIAQAKSSADKFKGLTIADDDEIAEVSKNSSFFFTFVSPIFFIVEF